MTFLYISIYLYYIYIFCISVFFLFCLSSFYYLFMPSNYIITIIIAIMFINITVTGILEKSSGESSKQGIQAACSTPLHHNDE